MNLYEINSQITYLLDFVDHETGEISDDALAGLEALEMAQEEKVLSLGKWIKNMTAESEALAVEIKNLQARKKLIENKIDRVKSYLQSTVPGKQFKDAQCVINWRVSKSVEVSDIDSLPDYLVRVKTERSPDKTLIKQTIESGVEVVGAKIVESQNLQIK